MAAFAVYISTLCPTVAGGDSGELIAAARVLGTVHPPGYPLYTLLARIFISLPVKDVAWRVNLLSAACDAAGAGVLAWSVARWASSLFAGVLASALFALSPLVWPYAVTAEVFPLNNLFAAALIAFTVAAGTRPPAFLLPLMAFSFGLGLSNHHTLLFLGIPALGYVAVLDRERLTRGRILKVGACFAAGFLPYLYLPLASLRNPPLAWGDPTTLDGFLTHLLRREYGTFRLAGAEVGPGGTVLPRVAHFAARFGATTAWAGPLLTLVAVLLPPPASGTLGRRLSLLWSAILVFYLVVFSSLANVRLDDPLHLTVQERFWQQAVVVGSALAGVGLAAVAQRLRGRLATALEATLAIGAALALSVSGWPAENLRSHFLFRSYGKAVLDSLPRGALLLVTSDEAVGSIRYMQFVEGMRQDVSVIPTGQLTSPWFRGFAARRLRRVSLPEGDFTAREFMDANIKARPVFLLNRIPWLQSLEEGYHPWPMGLAERVLEKGVTPPLQAWVLDATTSFGRFDPREADRFPEGSWERYLASNYWSQYRQFARTVVGVAAGSADSLEASRAVVAALEPLARADPAPESALFKNLGAAYQRLSATDPDAAGRMVYYWREFLAREPTDRDAGLIRQILEETGRGGAERGKT